jgi:hypothetical protein
MLALAVSITTGACIDSKKVGDGGRPDGDTDADGGPSIDDAATDGDALTDGCDDALRAKADAFGHAVDGLVSLVAELRADLAVACGVITETSVAADAADAELEAACAAAGDMVASLRSGAMVSLVPGRCAVDADAQLECERSCDLDTACDPGSVEERCEPGDLSVACDGECDGVSFCDGTAAMAATCEGTCAGVCMGMCAGTCNGTCDGSCSATGLDGECAGECSGVCEGSCSETCDGTCEGSCELSAGATVTCNAEARCEGGCTGSSSLPRCADALARTPCDLDGACEAACSGIGNFGVVCAPSTVVIADAPDAAIAARVKQGLPTIIDVLARSSLAADAASDVANTAGGVAAELSSSVVCAASYGASYVGKLQQSVAASAALSTLIMASATASGST